MSIKNKIILVTVLVIFFFGTLATYFVFVQTRDRLVELERNSLGLIAEEHAEITEEIFEDTWDITEKIASMDMIKGYLLSENDLDMQNAEILRLLDGYNLGDNYSSIYLMDKTGLTLVSTAESFVGNNYSFRKYFEEAIRGHNSVYVAVGVTSGSLGYYFSSPVVDENGQVIGVVVAKLKPDSVNRSLVTRVLSDHDDSKVKFLLLDESGVVIFSEDESKVYKSLGKMTLEQKRELEANGKFADIDIQSLVYNDLQKDLDFINGLSFYDVWDYIELENEILVISPVGDLPFYVIVKTTNDSIVDSAFNLASYLASFVLLAAFFAVIFISILVGSILKPLRELRQVAEKISEGDLGACVNIESKGEIAELGASFNKMTDRLVKSRHNIEEKVRERTKELEKMNNLMVGREVKMSELKKKINYLEKEVKNKN